MSGRKRRSSGAWCGAECRACPPWPVKGEGGCGAECQVRWRVECTRHRAPGTWHRTRHQAPGNVPYEQFADTILTDVTLRVGIEEAGVAVPRLLALDEPGALDDPGEVDEPGRSAVAL